MATRLDPLEYLERSDKWFLGGGHALCYAPPFPRYADAFGFWDEAHYADVPLERLFTVLILDENQRPLALRRDGRKWTPDALTHIHTASDGLRVREDKVVTPNDVLASRITIHNDGKRTRELHFVLWSLQDYTASHSGGPYTSAENTTKVGDYLAFAHTVDYGNAPYADRPADAMGWGERVPVAKARPAAPGAGGRHALHVALGSNAPLVSYTVNLAERSDTAPQWRISVAPEKLRDGRLPNTLELGREDADGHGDGHLHLCLHYTLEVPVGESRSIQFGAAVSLNKGSAIANLRGSLADDVAATSRSNWHEYFSSIPYFACDNPYLQRYYWYRWYGLRLSTVSVPNGTDDPTLPFRKPCVFEGIDGFRSHISYSAQCHMLETGWMHDPSLAYGCLEGMLAAQASSGFIPGHIYLWREGRGFYHANWGENALQLYHVTGDRGFIERIYPGLSRYADYFERDRDREDLHLYDILDQGETGQEYMSRYLFADAHADEWRRIQLKGVDATVYIYLLQRALARMADLLGKEEEAFVWNRKADGTRDAVRQYMWDPERKFFFDVDPRTMKRSTCMAAVGFYPFLCDIADESHLAAISEHLLNPEEFWTTWPVPATSKSDPLYSAEAEWRGKRMSCPWNGRVWPMTNTHVCEALARAALRLDPSLKPQAAWLIERFVKLMFWDGDPERPNCFEHYNPETGTPSMYRGIDDYQHSCVVDLLMKYLVGLQPCEEPALVLDPLPFDTESFCMEGITFRGHRVDVHWDRSEGYSITVDGVERSRTPDRQRVVIPLNG